MSISLVFLTLMFDAEISEDTASVLQYWKQRKYLRKNVWLESWLRREIQALTQV